MQAGSPIHCPRGPTCPPPPTSSPSRSWTRTRYRAWAPVPRSRGRRAADPPRGATATPAAAAPPRRRRSPAPFRSTADVRSDGEVRTSRLDVLAAIVVTLTAFIRNAIGTDAAFAVPTGNAGNTFSSIPDWKPPVVARAALVKAEGGIPGFVRAGGSYTVIASVTDDPSSNPPAGLATVQGIVAPGATAMPLPVSASSFGGQTYTPRSASGTVPVG